MVVQQALIIPLFGTSYSSFRCRIFETDTCRSLEIKQKTSRVKHCLTNTSSLDNIHWLAHKNNNNKSTQRKKDLGSISKLL